MGVEQWLKETGFTLTPETVATGLRVALLLVGGLVVARLVSRGLVRLVEGRLDRQQTQLVQRASFYLLLALFLVAALHQLGFELGVLLGAAGIFSVAIGFAAQTSASNFISGLFLVVERPFSVGDVIQVDGTTGEVLTVDLLSIKLRTFDNLFVRIPNETLIKTQVRTLTRFPIRRIDVQVGVAYGSELGRVHEVLLEVAESEPLSLEQPQPLIQFLGFGDSSVDLQFSVWALRENYLELKNRIHRAVHEGFARHGIEIPFPQRSIHAGSSSEPLAVRVVAEEDGAKGDR